MNDHLFTIDGIELCAESFGNPQHPTILLIMGAQSSMLWWEEEFCERLAVKGRHVIRYDNRDVGQSATYELGNPGYTFEDMADDAIRVLDRFGVGKAHIVGISMGGMLTQILALRHSARVRSVTLLATSNFAPDLPPMEEKVMAYFSEATEIDWTDNDAVIAFNVGKWKVLAGSRHAFDEQRIRNLAAAEVKRSRNIATMNNHGLVTGGESYLTRNEEIAALSLVIHGTEDPIIPYAHGVSLAGAIPGARLVTLEGTGHELHPADWDTIISEIIRHSEAVNQDE
ncbi:pimeloyl-ACP methyl ester carboxylesterase [Paenibacillus phyllosphaerae]|uniref:Pimeloyl-ACP methyl ester carboxylesterase n=1 Tax=Paenibacillus phyllosphaerae TaxID=274593 RepID=A0A7W5B4F6_9BACL|nr:alpha/beta hydrolase [Paenibacillus phyllosphaerae]MBB3114062.1 pimeloyl-ACP methyl ester carboxylesterase [Paenibacillus phyllosphaerae]